MEIRGVGVGGGGRGEYEDKEELKGLEWNYLFFLEANRLEIVTFTITREILTIRVAIANHLAALSTPGCRFVDAPLKKKKVEM